MSSDSAERAASGEGGLLELAELRDQVEALLEQLSAEADLGCASLDRAEAAEEEAAQLRSRLRQQVCAMQCPQPGAYLDAPKDDLTTTQSRNAFHTVLRRYARRSNEYWSTRGY